MIDDLSGPAPGDDVIIIAWPEPRMTLVPGNGWEYRSDGELIYSITLDDAPECVGEEPTEPEDDPAVPEE